MIRQGESVTAFRANGEAFVAAVQSVFITENRLWQIETEAGVLITTETQPLCLATDRTAPAGELVPGESILRRVDGEIEAVKVLSVTATDRCEKVFNLVVGPAGPAGPDLPLGEYTLGEVPPSGRDLAKGDCELFTANGFLARSKPPPVAVD
ncbi:MAG: hypothetical protein L0211_03940 [Planctomycetaceae bacterium]|nr:hypothetical protein [Planctomycetaceae bacterium]